jgi:hypothetical protein
MTAFEKGNHERRLIVAEYSGTQRENAKVCFTPDRHFGIFHNYNIDSGRAEISGQAGCLE